MRPAGRCGQGCRPSASHAAAEPLFLRALRATGDAATALVGREQVAAGAGGLHLVVEVDVLGGGARVSTGSRWPLRGPRGCTDPTCRTPLERGSADLQPLRHDEALGAVRATADAVRDERGRGRGALPVLDGRSRKQGSGVPLGLSSHAVVAWGSTKAPAMSRMTGRRSPEAQVSLSSGYISVLVAAVGRALEGVAQGDLDVRVAVAVDLGLAGLPLLRRRQARGPPHPAVRRRHAARHVHDLEPVERLRRAAR